MHNVPQDKRQQQRRAKPVPHADPDTCAEIVRLSDAVDAIGNKLDSLADSFATHAQHETDMGDKIDQALAAFPDGPYEHRKAHEAMIKAAKAQEAFWVDLRNDVLHKGIMFNIVVICGLIATGLAIKMGFGAPR